MTRYLAIVLAFLAAGCGGGTGPAPIFVGHVATLSGPGKMAGEQAARAIRLAVKEQNAAAAGKHSRPIHVRHTDTEGHLDAFEAEAVRLVTINRVIALLGGTSAEEVARLEKAQVPVITPAGASRGQGDWVFFTGLSPTFQGQVLARFAAENLHAANIVVITDEGRDGAAVLADAFTREFQTTTKTKGSPPAAPVWRFGKETPLADWAKRLASEKPKALVVASSVREFSRLRQGLHFSGPVLYAGGAVRELLDTGDADGVYTVTPFVSGLDIPRAKEFTTSYRQAYSEEPDESAALAYDGARLLFAAIDKVQAAPGTEGLVKETAKELANSKDFPGLTGPLEFNGSRQLVRPAFVVQIEKTGLKNVRRFPPTGASAAKAE